MYVKAQPNTSTASAREGGHVLEMQRRRLLLAYSEVLGEHGLQGTSVDRVCKRAGVSRRTFYDLFLDREGCFLGALEVARERIVSEILSAFVETGHNPGECEWNVRLRAGLTVLLELFDAEPVLARMCLVETLKGGPPVLAWRRAAIEGLVRVIDEGRVDGKGDPPSLAAEGIVGGVLSVIHTRLLERDTGPLLALVNPLMGMIVHPYLGPAGAAREFEHSGPNLTATHNGHAPDPIRDPFKDLPIRITFRTARVLAAMGARPGASNREIGDAAGIADQGQISKLLRRLERSGLASNSGEGHSRGEPNAWTLTQRGRAIQSTISPSVV